jgi:hypothetical protein
MELPIRCCAWMLMITGDRRRAATPRSPAWGRDLPA